MKVQAQMAAKKAIKLLIAKRIMAVQRKQLNMMENMTAIL